MSAGIPIGTKCSAPRLPDTHVRRPRLDDLFGGDGGHHVTLVLAPPGAGKTTLLASWSGSRRRERVGWLSLDRRDNDARRLAGLIVAALERAGAVPAFAPPAAEGEALLDALFDRLLAVGRPSVLMVDDLQEIWSPPALQILRHLVERTPRVLDLVLASRADPPIGCGRLQLAGRLREIRNAELSFRPDEAGELFAAHGVRLGRDDTRLLCTRTEGWAAGLRLAACALQSDAEPHRFVLSTSATQIAVSDYLLKEVLAREGEAAQQFLLRTSVADRLTPDLAAELTGDRRARERLEALERRGVFLVELDETGTYRYHGLFGTLLRARLRLQDADLYTDLHARAARWHLAHEMPVEAEEHARAAGRWELLGQLALARWLDAELDGRHLLDETARAVSPSQALGVAELALVAAADACRNGNQEDADLYRDAVDQDTMVRSAAGSSPPGGTPRPDAGDLDVGVGDAGTTGETPDAAGETPDAAARRIAGLVLDMAYGRAFGDDPRARAAVAALEFRPAADPWTERARCLAALRDAELDVGADRLDRARARLDDLAAADGGWLGLEASALLALLDAADGELVRAEERAGKALAGLDDGSRDAVPLAHLAVALCAAQRGEPRGVVGSLTAARAEPMPAWHVVRSAHRVAQASTRGRAVVAPGLDEPTLRGALVQRVLTALGALEVVDTAGRLVPVGGDGERAVATARQWLHDGGQGRPPAEVGRWLAGSSGGARATGTSAHPRTRIEARLLAALLADQAGDRTRVPRHLDAALSLSAATGIRAPFDALAARLAPLIDRHRVDLGAHTLTVELADRLAPLGIDGLVEQLTDRECEVLRYLPTMMSNVEIADGLHLSVNTVKTHLKAIYRKLGVEGRRHAVLRGRELELL